MFIVHILNLKWDIVKEVYCLPRKLVSKPHIFFTLKSSQVGVFMQCREISLMADWGDKSNAKQDSKQIPENVINIFQNEVQEQCSVFNL